MQRRSALGRFLELFEPFWQPGFPTQRPATPFLGEKFKKSAKSGASLR
jgi:hypothetical protein